MEGEMKPYDSRSLVILALSLSFQVFFPDLMGAQGPATTPQEESAQLKLRKSIKTREYQGQHVEGEERVVAPGDSLWKFLIQEKSLPEKQFARYVMIIGALNPHLKNPESLEVGDSVFVPIRLDELLGTRISASTESEAKIHRVRPGEHLYKILREQGIKDGAEMLSAIKQVQDMNPKKKNWDILFVGEPLFLPGRVAPGHVRGPAVAVPARAKKSSEDSIASERGDKLPLQENIPLLEQIMVALGNEVHRTGVEALPLQEGVVRVDRGSFPVIENPRRAQKVILDLKGSMPPILKSQMEKENSATRIVSAKRGTSLHEAVDSLLSQLGFQSLPPDRPVVIQDAGLGVMVKGDWIFADPQGSRGNHEMLIISLVESSAQTPDYLRDYLFAKGLNLKEIRLLNSLSTASNASPASESSVQRQIQTWPAEKSALVDEFLELYGVPFLTNHQISLPLWEGISMDFKIDRLFELGGKRMALLFRPVGYEVKRALESAEGLRLVDLDLRVLSSRDLISRLLDSIGEPTTYRQHRFPANQGRANDHLVLTVSGFFLPRRSLLLTDGEIPKGLERFFSEKGFRVVYFR
jgi:hypothetical protein